MFLQILSEDKKFCLWQFCQEFQANLCRIGKFGKFVYQLPMRMLHASIQ